MLIYGNSHIKLITTVYSDYKWLPWQFSSVSKGYWNDKQNQIEFMNWLFNKLNMKDMDDWYNVSWKVNKLINSKNSKKVEKIKKS